MEQCTASLIVVGNEILRGQIVDTNTSYLAGKLLLAGVKLQKVTVVPDVVDDIAREIECASKEYSFVFTSGGVGSTHGDVTYEGVAKALNLKLELNPVLMNINEQIIPDRHKIRRFSMVPNFSTVIPVTSTEIFPIIYVKNIYMLPGSPTYFESAVNKVITQLKGCIPQYMDFIDVQTSELYVLNILDRIAKKWCNKITFGSYSLSDYTSTRITLVGDRKEVVDAKEELLYYLPVRILMKLEGGMTRFRVKAVFEESKDAMHLKYSLAILNECYNRYNPNEIFICFNGGKDCTVVLYLTAIVARCRGIPLPLCLYVTTESFEEVGEFVQLAARYYDLKIIRKEPPIRTALSQFLEENSSMKACLMGMRKGDPYTENIKPFTPTDRDWPQLMRVNSILYWSYNRIWSFLLKHNIPYCTLYDKGYTSIGGKSVTTQNPLLRDPTDPSSYLPAYSLTDDSAERRGRL